MNRKLVLVMSLTIVLLGMLGIALKVQRVKANGAIYIYADGSVDPPDAPISSLDNITYTFTGNINALIFVLRDNITIDGKGYILNGTGTGYDEGLFIEWRNNVTVQNLNVINCGKGISIARSSNIKIVANIVTSNDYGILFDSSSNNIVSGNTITNSTEWGVYLWSSNNSAVSGNTITNSTHYGVSLGSSSNITVSGNTITNNYDGIYFFSSSNNNSISGNTITNSTHNGIRLDGESSNNTIYYNNFIDNPQHAYVNPNSLDNVWDDGYPFGGNYWSNYAGVDVNMDGVGDSDYEIDLTNIDNYPLMGMFSDFPAILEEETYHVTTVCNSTISAFEFNQVNRIIRFNVTGEESIGFCRVCIPHDLMEPPYTVTIDELAPLYVNYTLYDNGTHTWIIFTYQHSTHKVEIISEFPTWTAMLIVSVTLIVATVVYKRKLLKTSTH